MTNPTPPSELMTPLTRLGLLLSSALLLPLPATARPVTATVYDEWYHNRTTYCGQTYQHWGVSAAHPWLPCNTPVSVSHQGRTLTVRITDRCQCASLDLSAGAAYRLGVPLDGIATVNIKY
jgi:rare lipoprotein A